MSKHTLNKLHQAVLDGDAGTVRLFMGLADDEKCLALLKVAVERGHRSVVELLWPRNASVLNTVDVLTHSNMRQWPDLMRVMAPWCAQQTIDHALSMGSGDVEVVREMVHLASMRGIAQAMGTAVARKSLNSIAIMAPFADNGALRTGLKWAMPISCHTIIGWLLAHTDVEVTASDVYEAQRGLDYQTVILFFQHREIVMSADEATFALKVAAMNNSCPDEVVDLFMARGNADMVAQWLLSDDHDDFHNQYFMHTWRRQKALEEATLLGKAIDDVHAHPSKPSKM